MEQVVKQILRGFGSGALTRFGLASLPLIAGAAYATGSPGVLIVATFLVPVLLLGIRPSQARPYRLQLRSGGKADVEAVLELALATTVAHQRCAAVMIELDDHDKLVETWGADGAEMIMSDLTDRLCGVLRTTDVVARVGPARFAIGLQAIRVPELGAVVSLIERLQKAARAAIQIDGATAYVTVTAGFCLEARAPERSGRSLQRAAELALLDARSQGFESIRGFSSNTPAQVQDADGFAQDVVDALQKGQIVAWFQPQVSTDTGLVTGFEALARWDHPRRGIIAPDAFLPALEAAHGMELLSEAMLQHALRAMRAWDVAGHKVGSVAVNFATQDLRNPGLVERIKWDVDRFEMDPGRLTVEILETVVSASEDDVITRNIRALGDQGYRIDLDDFGTGHASLSNIRRFAVDRIKIDRSFVTRADEDPDQQRMVNAIISMAEQLGIETVAEGVETIGEKSILSQLGCTHMQGYAIAKPMPFSETVAWLQDHRTRMGKTAYLPRRAL